MNDTVELREESIAIEPLNRRDFQLAQWLEGITKQNAHRETVDVLSAMSLGHAITFLKPGTWYGSASIRKQGGNQLGTGQP